MTHSNVSAPEGFTTALQELKETVLLTDEAASVHMKNAVGESPIHVFAVRGDTHNVAHCLALGADVNARGEHGFTPLHEAAVQGHVELVRFLTQNGADICAQNDWGETPLAAVEALGDEAHPDVLKILGAANSRRTSKLLEEPK